MERISGIIAIERCLIEQHIPLRLTNSNTGRGHAWYAKANDRKEIEKLLISQGLQRQHPFATAIELHLTRYLSKGERLWDMDSGLRGNAKELIDSLVSIGWFYDDSPKWIREVRFFQDDSRRAIGGTLIKVCL